MVEIPSIRKSGPNSNSFFDGLRVPAYARRSGLLRGYIPSLIAVGFIALFVAGTLAWRQAQMWQSIGQSSHQLRTLADLALRTQHARAQVDQVLRTGDFSDADQALAALIQTLRITVRDASVAAEFDLPTLETLAQTTQNTLRGLATLEQAGAQAQPALSAIREDAGQSAKQMADYADTLSMQAISTFDEVLNRHSSENGLSQIALFVTLCGVLVTCTALFAHLNHATNAGLDSMMQAVQSMTHGDFEQHPAAKRTDKIGELARAFNDMARRLQTARQTEAAANEQNRRQIMKLAQQERMTAILEERHRIARELHDSVKQQLFSINLAAGAALNLLDHDLGLARTYLSHVQHMGTAAQSEMTTLLLEMTPAPLHDHQLEDALYQYLVPLCELHKLKLLWRVEGTNTLTIAHEHALFRIVQEATSNVIRHGGAVVLRISLRFGLQTSLIIEDDGGGFDPALIPRTSTGLATMRLRVKQIGGRLTVASIIGQGTKLEIILDLRRKV